LPFLTKKQLLKALDAKELDFITGDEPEYPDPFDRIACRRSPLISASGIGSGA
jgi:hypothetical protein